MNEEQNNFQIDVEAETQAMSPSLEPNEFKPSESIFVMKDIPLPEMTFYEPSESFKKSSSVSPQLSNQVVDYSLKVDAEEAYLKAEETENKLKMMASGIQELAEGLQPGWLENRNKDDFEERVVVEPINLLFGDRRERMSFHPNWH